MVRTISKYKRNKFLPQRREGDLCFRTGRQTGRKENPHPKQGPLEPENEYGFSWISKDSDNVGEHAS